MGLRTVTPKGELLGYNCSPVYGCAPAPVRGMGIDYIASASFLHLSDIFFVLGHRISFFWYVPVFFINCCCDFGVLMGRGELKVFSPLSCLLNLAMCCSVLLLQAKSTSSHPDLVSAMWLDVANRMWAKSLSEPVPRS